MWLTRNKKQERRNIAQGQADRFRKLPGDQQRREQLDMPQLRGHTGTTTDWFHILQWFCLCIFITSTTRDTMRVIPPISVDPVGTQV